MRKILYGFLCLIMIYLAGCADGKITPDAPENLTPTENLAPLQAPHVAVSEPELFHNIKAISVKWQDDRLVYLTNNGLFAYLPSDGTTQTLMSDDISKKDIGWINFNFSPDKSKYIMVTGGMYDNTLEIRDATTDKSILLFDTQKYRDGVGDYSPYVMQAGWIDNENIFLATEFRLFMVNITTGEQVQVTEECSPITTKVSHNVEAPYLSWSNNVTKIGDKLYYNSKRVLKSPPSIYCGDKSGERELIKNATFLIPADESHLVYSRESKPGSGSFNTFIYDIDSGNSSLITDEDLLNQKIFRIKDGKLSFMTGDITGGVYHGVIFDPETLQSQKFDVYDVEKDFPDIDPGQCQFGHFMGAFEENGEYVFLFSVDNLSASQQKYIAKYLSYSTKTKKLSEIADYGDTWLVSMDISPSEEYILITKHGSPGDDDFLFDVIKSDALLLQTELN